MKTQVTPNRKDKKKYPAEPIVDFLDQERQWLMVHIKELKSYVLPKDRSLFREIKADIKSCENIEDENELNSKLEEINFHIARLQINFEMHSASSFHAQLDDHSGNRNDRGIFKLKIKCISRLTSSVLEYITTNIYANDNILSLSLDLSNNFLKVLPEIPFPLDSLILNNNKKIKLPYEGIEVRNVYLKNCDLNEFPLEILSCKGIEKLYLTSNNISQIPFALTLALSNLKVLSLFDNNFQSMPKALYRIPRETQIYISSPKYPELSPINSFYPSRGKNDSTQIPSWVRSHRADNSPEIVLTPTSRRHRQVVPKNRLNFTQQALQKIIDREAAKSSGDSLIQRNDKKRCTIL